MSRTYTSQAAAYDVIVVGGGMVGSAFACALGNSALKVAVVEPQKAPEAMGADYGLRVSALTLASQTILESLGAWQGVVQRRFGVVSAMQVWDEAGGEVRFDAAEIGEPYLAFIVENNLIVAALRERLHQFTNAHWIDGTIADLKTEESTHAMLADGRSLRGHLIVAADGADSPVRERLNLPVQALSLDQLGIVATVRTERSHQHIAWQKFLPTGPIALLPLSEPNACSIVWSADRVRAEELLALNDAAFLVELNKAFGDRLGNIRSISARAAFPLGLAHAQRYITERTALIGDAAHTVHPLAGQGVNLGFLDAAALAEVVLKAAAERRDIGALHVLRRYERWRKGDNLAMVAVTGGFKFLFGSERPIAAKLRRFGLSATEHLTPVKNAIMRRASGLTGDLPSLARRVAR